MIEPKPHRVETAPQNARRSLSRNQTNRDSAKTRRRTRRRQPWGILRVCLRAFRAIAAKIPLAVIGFSTIAWRDCPFPGSWSSLMVLFSLIHLGKSWLRTSNRNLAPNAASRPACSPLSFIRFMSPALIIWRRKVVPQKKRRSPSGTRIGTSSSRRGQEQQEQPQEGQRDG